MLQHKHFGTKGGELPFDAVDTKFGSTGRARATKAFVCQGGFAWIHIGGGGHIIKAPTDLRAEDVGAAVAWTSVAPRDAPTPCYRSLL